MLWQKIGKGINGMVCLNVQGFLRHKDEIEVMLHRITASLVGFTETHVTQEVEDHELYISGYACV